MYNTVSGVGITLGNLATGALWDAASHAGYPQLLWGALTAVGLACAACVALLASWGRLSPQPQPQPSPAVA